MIFVHVDGAEMELDTRKLDNLGYIKSYGGVKNNPEHIFRLNNNLYFSQ